MTNDVKYHRHQSHTCYYNKFKTLLSHLTLWYSLQVIAECNHIYILKKIESLESLTTI